jgi:hypothetical protein
MFTRIAFVALIPALISLVAACQGSSLPNPQPESQAGAVSAVWGMRAGNAQRQGRSPLAGPAATNQRWSFAADGNFDSAPVLAEDGGIYAAADRILLAFDRHGNFRWRYQADSDIDSAPGVSADGTIRVATRNGSIHAVNPDGTRQAVYDSHLPYIADAVFDRDGTAYMHSRQSPISNPTLLQATGPAGEDLWHAEIDESFTPGVEFAADQLYFRTINARAIVYSTDGELLWRLERPQLYFYGRAIAPSGMVYIFAQVPDNEDEYQVTAYSRAGAELWSRPVSYGYSQNDKTPQAGPDDTLYVSDDDDVMHVFSPAGEELWSKDNVSEILGVSPAGYVYTLDGNWQHYRLAVYNSSGYGRWGSDTYHDFRGHLVFTPEDTILFTGYAQGAFEGGLADTVPYGLHELLPTGEIIWSYRPSGGSIGNLVVDQQGTTYVSTLGALFALDQDGQILWRSETIGVRNAEAVSSSLVFGPHNYLYCVGRDNQLHCFNTDGLLLSKISIGATTRINSMAADSNLIYVPLSASLLAYDAQGNQVYQFTADKPLEGSPAIGADGAAYVVDKLGTGYAISGSGTEFWRFASGFNSEWPYPVIAGADQVLFPIQYGVAALDSAGQELWRFANDEEKLHCLAPVVAPDGQIDVLAYATTQSPPEVPDDVFWLVALATDGQLRWKLELALDFFTQPVVDRNGVIYLYNLDHVLVAVSPGGEELWRDERYNTGEHFNFPDSIVIAPDGRLLVNDRRELRALGL